MRLFASRFLFGVNQIMSPTALFLVGPTASGKTALALALAQTRPIEIISIDSALVFQDMNIGTAKPTAAELAICPHHLIDIIPPTAVYDAAQWQKDASSLITDIHQRGALPVLVGGTMLYAQALLDGLNDLPMTDASVRARVNAAAAEKGWPQLHAELALVDPETAARLQPNDAQRISRAWEVYWISGQPLSQWLKAEKTYRREFDAVVCALLPSNRAVLHERIASRFHAMLAAGFVDEVRALQKKYPSLTADTPSMRCVGYRQAWAHLEGETTHEVFVEKGIIATRQLAKRQMTWLRKMPNTQLLDCLADSNLENLQKIIEKK